MGVVTTKKNVGIVAILEKVLGPAVPTSRTVRLVVALPALPCRPCLTADVWTHTWRCVACKRHGDALDLLAGVWGITTLQAAARAGLPIPEPPPRTDRHPAKPRRGKRHVLKGEYE